MLSKTPQTTRKAQPHRARPPLSQPTPREGQSHRSHLDRSGQAKLPLLGVCNNNNSYRGQRHSHLGRDGTAHHPGDMLTRSQWEGRKLDGRAGSANGEQATGVHNGHNSMLGHSRTSRQVWEEEAAAQPTHGDVGHRGRRPPTVQKRLSKT